MKDSPLEQIARQYGNVVQYDEKGNPSIYVKFAKMKSSDLASNLPAHTHPAFMIDGKEEDAILIGKFKCAELAENGVQYSLPNVPPRTNLDYDSFLERMRAAGNGASGMTIADHGLLVLLTHKNNWRPYGNTMFGTGYDDLVSYWTFAGNYDIGEECAFRGWVYECLIAHKASSELLPCDYPLYWKRIRRVGGIPADENFTEANLYQGDTTINGSGPLDWYLGSDLGSLCDIVGNCSEMVYGLRLVNCEIQILGDNNDAACADADCSANAAWKAILPSKTTNSYTLVEPGTAGTVHYTYRDGAITLDTVEPEFDGNPCFTDFGDIKVNTANMPYVPSILYELGLAPISGTPVSGEVVVFMTREERLPRRGGYNGDSSSGMGSLDFAPTRSDANHRRGARARSMPNP